jgi:sugar O-acyltransferase (sialic acid O-acetyltransferase NeuD family)
MGRYFIYGAGGHGKVVADAMLVANLQCDGFIDSGKSDVWFGLSVYKPNNIRPDDKLHIAIGNASIRYQITVDNPDFSFFSVIHPSSHIAKSAFVSEVGVFIAASAIIGPDATVADHTIINHAAIIDHDCKVGRFCHIAPGAVLGGSVAIGNNVLIGAGAIILPGLTICDNATIGAGAVVTKSIDQPQTLVGIPAKSIDIS